MHSRIFSFNLEDEDKNKMIYRDKIFLRSDSLISENNKNLNSFNKMRKRSMTASVSSNNSESLNHNKNNLFNKAKQNVLKSKY